MLAYLVLLAVYAALLGLGRLVSQRYGSPQVVTLFDIAAVVTLALFAGLRGTTVGYDTPLYERWYEYHIVPGYWWESWQYSGHDIGYAAIEMLAKTQGVPFAGLVFLVSVATVAMTAAGLWMLSPAPRATLLLYVTLSVYLFPMNGHRQGLAIAIVVLMCALWYQTRNNLWLLLAVPAVLIHYSAIVGVAVVVALWVMSRTSGAVRVGLGTLVVLVPLVLALTGTVTAIMTDINPRYGGYIGEEGAGFGTWMSIIFRIAIIVVALVILGRRAGSGEAFVEIAAVAVGVVFLVIGFSSLAISRFDFYFLPFATTLIPRVVMASKFPTLVGAGFAVAALAYYIAYLSAWGGLLPYTTILTP